MTQRTHLVFFDPHVRPGDDFKRFAHLGKLILDRRPDVILCGGDFASLDSCSTHEQPGSRRHNELPKTESDRDAVVKAQQILFDSLRRFNGRRVKTKHKQYRPRTIMVCGNHEDRFHRWAAMNHRQVDGLMDFETVFGLREYWSEIHNYKAVVEVDGVRYTHVPHSTMGRPIGGTTKTNRSAALSAKPLIFGHGHDLQVTTIGDITGGPANRFAMSAPAFMEDGRIEEYAKGSQSGWSYGVLMVKPQGEGRIPSFEYISTRDLAAQYGE